MNRRQFLATLGPAIAVPGCLGGTRQPRGADGYISEPQFLLKMKPVNHTEIAREYATPLSELPAKRIHAAYESAIKNGTATYTSTDRTPMRPGEQTVIRTDGTVYGFSVDQTESTDRKMYHYTVTIEAVETPSDDETVLFSSLPQADRDALGQRQLMNPDSDRRFNIGTSLVYSPDERNASILVSSPEEPVIQWPSGARARFSVRDESVKRTYRHRVSATELGSAAAFGRRLESRVAFPLSNTTTAEENILREAIENDSGYELPAEATPTESLSDTIEQLNSRFTAQFDKSITPGHNGLEPNGVYYLVTYNNQTYWVVRVVGPPEEFEENSQQSLVVGKSRGTS
jgi:hypothetical protein